MDLINSNGEPQELLSTADISVCVLELGELQLALVGGGIGDTQL